MSHSELKSDLRQDPEMPAISSKGIDLNLPLEAVKRPSFRFRLQLTLGLILLFTLSMAIILGSMLVIKRIQVKLQHSESSERFFFEVEQARRWEKNYFLYNTNLVDASHSIIKAKLLFAQDYNSYKIILGQQADSLMNNLNNYEELIQELISLEKHFSLNQKRKHEIESLLRQYGGKAVESAASLTFKQQDAVNELLNLVQRFPIYALIVYLLINIYVAFFLIQRFMKRLNSLIYSTQRIAEGDFPDTMPVKKYRDEFSTVSAAFNRMLKELNDRQKAMVESHKLKAIGTLTAGVAHELNNPVNNIMLTAHMLIEDYKSLSDKEMLELINDLINETNRTRSILHNLLDFARESESISEPIDLGLLVSESLKLVLNQVKVAGAKIDVSIASGLPKIRGDKQKLKQVFINLILNSVDAIEKGGEIKVRVEMAKTAGFLAVYVQDNGCGISPQMLPFIFDPFFTNKMPGKGTGLGLSVSHGIVSMHGGKIQAESTEFQGTRFTVLFPIIEIASDR